MEDKIKTTQPEKDAPSTAPPPDEEKVAPKDDKVKTAQPILDDTTRGLVFYGHGGC